MHQDALVLVEHAITLPGQMINWSSKQQAYIILSTVEFSKVRALWLRWGGPDELVSFER